MKLVTWLIKEKDNNDFRKQALNGTNLNAQCEIFKIIFKSQ